MLYLGYNLNNILEKEKFIKKLPIKKRRFAEIFTTTLCLDKTCKILGISLRQGYNLLRAEDVQTAISYLQDLIAFRNTITQDYFIKKLKELIENNNVKPADKIAALTLLAKITGHLREKVENNAQVVVFKSQGLLTTPNQPEEI